MHIPNQFIIFDTEYTAWKDSQETGWANPLHFKELVQIAAYKIVKKDNSLFILDSFKVLIKPKKNPILSDYFINLTKIQQNELDETGLELDMALEQFYQFSKGLTLYSYGNDFEIIEYNLDLNNHDQMSKYRFWESSFFDFKMLVYKFCDTKKYSSGTLYQAFQLVPDNNICIHDALWDSYSLFISLNYLYKNSYLL